MAEDVFLLGAEYAGYATRAGLLVPEQYATEGPMPAGVIIVGADVTATIRQEVRSFEGEIDPGERAVLMSYGRFLSAAIDTLKFERQRRRAR
jgi:hypothetical protein